MSSWRSLGGYRSGQTAGLPATSTQSARVPALWVTTSKINAATQAGLWPKSGSSRTCLLLNWPNRGYSRSLTPVRAPLVLTPSSLRRGEVPGRGTSAAFCGLHHPRAPGPTPEPCCPCSPHSSHLHHHSSALPPPGSSLRVGILTTNWRA